MGAKHSDAAKPTSRATKTPTNSKTKATHDQTYIPIPKPSTLGETQDALNLWAVYLNRWMTKAREDIMNVESILHIPPHDDHKPKAKRAAKTSPQPAAKTSPQPAAAPVAVQATTHLDPPPEQPFVLDSK